jgi:CRISPR-associated protein Csh2
MTIEPNSVILFIYDAKMSNPNGDMDNENKPRMDYDTSTNLVTDVRLKRYVRDYFEKACGKEIFITEKAKDAKDRGKQLKAKEMQPTDLIDVRLFGAVLAQEGASDHLTGPVQFNWGYSLNPVELNETSTITSSFSSGEGVGKDFRVKYSVIGFSGGINANTAEHTQLANDDVAEFDQAMIKAIPFCRTRSKTGQTPRLYLRVEASDDKLVLKDLREYISLEYHVENEYALRDIHGFSLKINKLVDYLANMEIDKLHFWKDDLLNVLGWDELNAQFKGRMVPIKTGE